MRKRLVAAIAVLGLAGCAYQSEAQINAELARHIGEPEADLIREKGVPARHYDSGGHRFLAYVTGYQQINAPPGFGGPGFGYPGYGGFGWGWGPWYGGGYGDWGGPNTIVSYGCETTFEISGGHVIGYTRHGNNC